MSSLGRGLVLDSSICFRTPRATCSSRSPSHSSPLAQFVRRPTPPRCEGRRRRLRPHARRSLRLRPRRSAASGLSGVHASQRSARRGAACPAGTLRGAWLQIRAQPSPAGLPWFTRSFERPTRLRPSWPSIAAGDNGRLGTHRLRNARRFLLDSTVSSPTRGSVRSSTFAAEGTLLYFEKNCGTPDGSAALSVAIRTGDRPRRDAAMLRKPRTADHYARVALPDAASRAREFPPLSDCVSSLDPRRGPNERGAHLL